MSSNEINPENTSGNSRKGPLLVLTFFLVVAVIIGALKE